MGDSVVASAGSAEAVILKHAKDAYHTLSQYLHRCGPRARMDKGSWEGLPSLEHVTVVTDTTAQAFKVSPDPLVDLVSLCSAPLSRARRERRLLEQKPL